MHKVDKSALLTVIGVVLLFATSVSVVLIAPLYVDDTWVSPSSPYQVQMYEVEDPHIYISGSSPSGLGVNLQYIQHIRQDYTLLAFQESESLRIITSPELEKYISRYKEPNLKLTSRLLFLRNPEKKLKKAAIEYRSKLQDEWKTTHADWEKQGLDKINYQILELYDPEMKEAFSFNASQGLLQNWVDTNFKILDDPKEVYHRDHGVVYALNPQEYLISPITVGDRQLWQYDPEGKKVSSIEELKQLGMGFLSRKDLISLGEHIYSIEGCWYCHTDQTRTLVQDVVLNGSDSYPAPPSSPNEYIYQKITFPGTRRIGPDISRVGVKRPSRDWHKAHFWAPKTASAGSIMPSFKHFFDNDPRGTGRSSVGIPNYQFEAIYQYLMTKGTRITPPTQAWWLGKDPIRTKEIIEGARKLQ
ncbi:MAG: cbb3-type cytochrome c oxidase subunit II [Parachlamydiaceae bacterium]|nr:cbb3-type cytochrome c oxidase subunit II [Parachlamydiaceae bacterium]